MKRLSIVPALAVLAGGLLPGAPASAASPADNQPPPIDLVPAHECGHEDTNEFPHPSVPILQEPRMFDPPRVAGTTWGFLACAGDNQDSWTVSWLVGNDARLTVTMQSPVGEDYDLYVVRFGASGMEGLGKRRPAGPGGLERVTVRQQAGTPAADAQMYVLVRPAGDADWSDAEPYTLRYRSR